jgi:hypothetical protein
MISAVGDHATRLTARPTSAPAWHLHLRQGTLLSSASEALASCRSEWNALTIDNNHHFVPLPRLVTPTPVPPFLHLQLTIEERLIPPQQLRIQKRQHLAPRF